MAWDACCCLTLNCQIISILLTYNVNFNRIAMENRTARLTLLIDPVKKQIFEEICAARDRTPSQVVRQLIREYIRQYGTAEQVARMPQQVQDGGE